MKKTFSMALATLALSLAGCDAGDGPTTISRERVVTVESSPALSERIKAGRFDFGPHDDMRTINAFFRIEPISADYKPRFVLVQFNRFITTETALSELRNLNLRPANTAECIAYGAAINHATKEFDLQPPRYMMICLGSKSRYNSRQFLSLYDGDIRRQAPTSKSFQSDWKPENVFLVVR